MESKINIPFYRPSIGFEEIKAVTKVLESGWLTTGKITNQFEKEIAKLCNVKYALAVNSATSGLFLSLNNIITKDSVVITTPFTFVSTANIIEHCGAKVLFVDIDSETYNINPTELIKALSKTQVSAIIPVHIAGLPCDMEKIKMIGDGFNVPILEDCAHLFPYKNLVGRAGVFSFYTTKNITTAEGGMVITNDENLANSIKKNRFHGISEDVYDRYINPDRHLEQEYDIIDCGYKCNMPDILSAIGIEQLKKLDYFIKRRKSLAFNYINALSEIKEVIKLPVNSDDHVWHLFIIQVPDRLSFRAFMSNNGIGTSVHFRSLTSTYYYRATSSEFPVANQVSEHVVSLPLYPDLMASEQDYIIEKIKEFFKLHLY